MRCTNSLMKRGASVLATAGMLMTSVCRADDPRADVLSGPDQRPERVAGTQGMLTFGGSTGFLDYSKPIVPTADALNQLPWLVLRGGAAESQRDLRADQTRGQRIELNWGLLDSLDQNLPFRAVMPLFDGERREMVFVHSEHRGAGRFTWYGQLAGIAASDFILVREGEAVWMVLRDYQNRKSVEINFVPAAGHALRECASKPATPSLEPEVAVALGSASGFTARGPGCPGDPVNIVGIMFACAQGNAAGTIGTEDNFRAVVTGLAADFNLRASNSQANVQLRVMRDDFLEEVVASDSSQLSDLNPFQDRYKADLGALLVSGATLTGTIPHSPADLTSGHSTFRWGIGNNTRDFSYMIGRMCGACRDASEACDSSFPAPRGYVGHCTEFLAPFCNEYYYDTMADVQSQSCVDADYPIPYFSNPNITYTSSSACSTNVVMGDSQSNVAALMTANRSTISQYQIAAPIWFADATRGSNPADGSNFNPSSSIKYAVDHISGGVSCAVIFADGEWNDTDGIFNETAANGGPVLLSTPCVIRSNKNTPVHVR